MTASNFKTEIKEVSSQLRGLTLQLITTNGVTPYNSLNEFGNAILKEENKGNSISVTQVWTSAGVVQVNSFEHLSELLNTSNIKAVQFRSFYAPLDFSDYLIKTLKTTN